jgi:predicted ATPase
VVIENYKSITHCDVSLGPLTFLVGRNGAGKSNFLDALRFIADALNTNLDAAVRARGSFDDLRFRDAEPEAPIIVHFDLALPGDRIGHYALRLSPRAFGGYAIAEERCSVEYPAGGNPPAAHAPTGFHLRDGRALHNPNDPRIFPTDRLYLPVAVSDSFFDYERPVYDLLANMAFYQPIPAQMQSPSPHEPGDLLLPDGRNVAGVVLRLAQHQPAVLERITDYLHAILPTLQAVGATAVGGYDALQFQQQCEGDDPLRFYRETNPASPNRPFTAMAMSGDTLHALGVLVALFQGGFGDTRKPAVIGIEEPEASLHPAATAVLRDACEAAAELSQVLVATQSADLLDTTTIAPEAILAVDRAAGATRIGPLGAGQASILRDHLATAGELLRTSTFLPDPAARDGRQA